MPLHIIQRRKEGCKGGVGVKGYIHVTENSMWGEKRKKYQFHQVDQLTEPTISQSLNHAGGGERKPFEKKEGCI